MYIESDINPDGAFKNELTNGEWVRFSDGTARVTKDIGEQLAEHYDHITIQNEE